jgi:hypothetical protein
MTSNQRKSTLAVALALLALRAGAIDAPSLAAQQGAPAANPTTTAPAVTAPSLSVADILSRNAQARGGADAWRKIQALAYSGKMDAGRKRPLPDNEFGNPNASPKERRKERIVREREVDAAPVIQVPFKLEVARGRKSRLEVVVNDKTAVQVYDGHSGWKLRPYMGPGRKPEPFTAEELKLAADQADLDGWLLDAHAQGSTVSSEGVDAVDGKAAYKLKVLLANGDVRHVWVDAETFLDVRVEGARRFDGKLKPMYTALKDYRTVDGVKVPFLMETRIAGYRDTDRIVIETATANPAITPDHFSKL